MESPSAHFLSSRDQPRRPSYTHSSSRSSITTSESRMSLQTSDRSMSSLALSSQLPHSQECPQQQQPAQSSQSKSHYQRIQNGDLNKRGSPAPSNSTDSSRFRSLNESSFELKPSDSKPSLTVTSSYLQEKLSQERKTESERSSSRLGHDKMTSSLDLRGVQSSPARPFFDISRPKSSIGHLDSGKKKGVGLKEMEQVCI